MEGDTSSLYLDDAGDSDSPPNPFTQDSSKAHLPEYPEAGLLAGADQDDSDILKADGSQLVLDFSIDTLSHLNPTDFGTTSGSQKLSTSSSSPAARGTAAALAAPLPPARTVSDGNTNTRDVITDVTATSTSQNDSAESEPCMAEIHAEYIRESRREAPDRPSLPVYSMSYTPIRPPGGATRTPSPTAARRYDNAGFGAGGVAGTPLRAAAPSPFRTPGMSPGMASLISPIVGEPNHSYQSFHSPGFDATPVVKKSFYLSPAGSPKEREREAPADAAGLAREAGGALSSEESGNSGDSSRTRKMLARRSLVSQLDFLQHSGETSVADFTLKASPNGTAGAPGAAGHTFDAGVSPIAAAGSPDGGLQASYVVPDPRPSPHSAGGNGISAGGRSLPRSHLGGSPVSSLRVTASGLARGSPSPARKAPAPGSGPRDGSRSPSLAATVGTPDGSPRDYAHSVPRAAAGAPPASGSRSDAATQKTPPQARGQASNPGASAEAAPYGTPAFSVSPGSGRARMARSLWYRSAFMQQPQASYGPVQQQASAPELGGRPWWAPPPVSPVMAAPAPAPWAAPEMMASPWWVPPAAPLAASPVQARLLYNASPPSVPDQAPVWAPATPLQDFFMRQKIQEQQLTLAAAMMGRYFGMAPWWTPGAMGAGFQSVMPEAWVQAPWPAPPAPPPAAVAPAPAQATPYPADYRALYSNVKRWRQSVQDARPPSPADDWYNTRFGGWSGVSAKRAMDRLGPPAGIGSPPSPRGQGYGWSRHVQRMSSPKVGRMSRVDSRATAGMPLVNPGGEALGTSVRSESYIAARFDQLMARRLLVVAAS